MNNPLVQPDPGLFIWTILTFLVLLWLLAKFAWRPLLQALESRQELIRKSLDDAQEARRELERLHVESAQILKEARVQADSIITQTRSDGERLRVELAPLMREPGWAWAEVEPGLEDVFIHLMRDAAEPHGAKPRP